MKRCPQCGARFTDSNSFCLDDGTVLISESPQANQRGVPEAEAPTVKMSSDAVSEHRARRPRWMFVVLLVLVVALTGVIGYIFLANNLPRGASERIGSDDQGRPSNVPFEAPVNNDEKNLNANSVAVDPQPTPTPLNID